MAATVAPISTRYDFFVPAFEVRLGGRSVSREVLRDVLAVSYTDSLDKLDSCQLTLSNWDEERRDFKYVGRRSGEPAVALTPGTGVELWIGYRDRGNLSLVLRGEIVSVSPDFPAGGQPTVQVRALNKLYKLHFKQETTIFTDKTDSQIAEEVVARLGQELASRGGPANRPLELRLETDPRGEEPHPYVALANEYPIVFLLERARHNGYDLFLEEEEGVTTLHFHPPDRRRPITYELVWGETLVSFKPTLATKEQVSRVKVRGWDEEAKESFEEEATWDDLDNPGLPKLAELAAADSALSGSEIVIADEPVFSRHEAKQKAKDHLTALANGLVTGSGSTVGLPELRAGRPLHIRKLGPPFSGRYLVTGTTHQLGDGGYVTQFEARMEQPDEAGTR